MLRFSLALALLFLGLPAEAQQGRNDYPTIIPRDWTLLPPKLDEWRAVSPRKALGFPFTQQHRMSAFGTKRTSVSGLPMSAIGGKADMART
jgi:hypothetical protein